MYGFSDCLVLVRFQSEQLTYHLPFAKWKDVQHTCRIALGSLSKPKCSSRL